MKLSEFFRLSEQEKRVSVLEHGAPVAKRETAEHLVFLFQLYAYYVETYCCLRTKEILEYRVIHHTDHLAHYLDHIPIDHLFERKREE